MYFATQVISNLQGDPKATAKEKKFSNSKTISSNTMQFSQNCTENNVKFFMEKKNTARIDIFATNS